MAMQGSLVDFIISWMTIPLRILVELYWWWFPPKEDIQENDRTGVCKVDPTIDKDELNHYTKLAACWWDPEGDFALLRGANHARIPLIIRTYSKMIETSLPDALPLLGARIIDVGCGAGFVSEPLVEFGAHVTGVDMVPENIKTAQAHWKENHEDGEPGPNYVCAPIEKISQQHKEEFDMVLCFEVVDHVRNMPEFVAHCCRLVRPGGYAIFSTINQKLASLIVAIIGGEHLLRIVPMNTHHLYKFVKPNVLIDEIAAHGLRTDVSLTGSFPLNPLAKRPKWIETPRYTGVCYTLVAKKD